MEGKPYPRKNNGIDKVLMVEYHSLWSKVVILGLRQIGINEKMHMNDQNPILYEWKTTLSDLRPVSLNKKDMVLVWFSI